MPLSTRNSIRCNKSRVRTAVCSSSICLKCHTIIDSWLTIEIGKSDMSKCIIAIEIWMFDSKLCFIWHPIFSIIIINIKCLRPNTFHSSCAIYMVIDLYASITLSLQRQSIN